MKSIWNVDHHVLALVKITGIIIIKYADNNAWQDAFAQTISSVAQMDGVLNLSTVPKV